MRTFEDILSKRLKGSNKQRKIPAYLVTTIKQKGFDLQDTTLEVLLNERVPEEQILDQVVESASIRIDNILEGIISSDIFDHRNFGKPKEIVKTGKVEVSGGLFGLRDKRGRLLGALSLSRLLNLVLFKYVRANMKYPKLVNRTGRFSHSANITKITGVSNLEQQRESGVSVFFSYMVAPYSIFEKTEPWAKGGLRSPKELIRMSIRDALRDIILPESYKQARVDLFNFEFEEPK